jgi:hypothetical protein
MWRSGRVVERDGLENHSVSEFQNYTLVVLASIDLHSRT